MRREAEARILIADDDSYMRDLLVAVFRREGYEVSAAPTGLEVLERIHDPSEPALDMIVTDAMMPEADGFEVLRAVERLDAPPAVILITAFGDPLTHRRALEHGAVEVVDKPFDLDAMRRLVRRVLRAHARPGR
jgi:CheY-like chemotaxis protein